MAYSVSAIIKSCKKAFFLSIKWGEPICKFNMLLNGIFEPWKLLWLANKRKREKECNKTTETKTKPKITWKNERTNKWRGRSNRQQQQINNRKSHALWFDYLWQLIEVYSFLSLSLFSFSVIIIIIIFNLSERRHSK